MTLCLPNFHLLVLVAEELAHVLDHLIVRELAVRLLLTQGQGFPKRHAERPDVTRRGEFTLKNTKTRHQTLVRVPPRPGRHYRFITPVCRC